MRNTCRPAAGAAAAAATAAVTYHTYQAHISLKRASERASKLAAVALWPCMLMRLSDWLWFGPRQPGTFWRRNAYHCCSMWGQALVVLIRWSKYAVVSVKHMSVESVLSPRPPTPTTEPSLPRALSVTLNFCLTFYLFFNFNSLRGLPFFILVCTSRGNLNLFSYLNFDLTWLLLLPIMPH